MAKSEATIKIDFQNLEAVKKEIERLNAEVEYYKLLTSGWDSYAWKDDEYIDDIQEYFDEQKKSYEP
jgi:hypothetical protein